MSDVIPGTASVTDQRPRPRGVLPRHAQTWLMLALAVGILAVIVFTGKSNPPERQRVGSATTNAAPDADRLRDYQERLRLLDERARQRSAAPVSAATVPPPHEPAGASTQPDPLVAEKKRREYESLFAGVLVAGAGTPRQERSARTHGQGIAADPSSASSLLDAVVDAVLKASGQTLPAAGAASAGSANQREISATPRLDTTATGLDPRPRLAEGTIIPAVLTNRLEGGAEGPVNCLVTSPVYATNGLELLIPAGARVLGRSKPVQTLGESRLAVVFHRLLMPDGHDYPLDQFIGLNQIGDARLRDQVNAHYWSTFGAASAVGLLTGLSQAIGSAVVGSGDRTPTIILAGAGSEGSQATARTFDRLLNRPPSITIREGLRVHVYLTSDLHLPSYGDSASMPDTRATLTKGSR